jgi:hypothetical protein
MLYKSGVSWGKGEGISREKGTITVLRQLFLVFVWIKKNNSDTVRKSSLDTRCPFWRNWVYEFLKLN